jgi:hypothetical protein
MNAIPTDELRVVRGEKPVIYMKGTGLRSYLAPVVTVQRKWRVPLGEYEAVTPKKENDEMRDRRNLTPEERELFPNANHMFTWQSMHDEWRDLPEA